ncbi:hypothetical protein DQ244_16315 [Blastococcus sp. TBT05-19]|uniref:hypothetical protein n=1 Tax=Blastococcus sp. TBT05-19 TaxID=2250581 RepID=UPI000DE86E03|nr:hypothetical protein [Blastococcus sp. TBT05-19]RBY88243.1 hypothetical protein DQ244_16315 [Blastococcus sp. TBT05-19]
MTTPALADVPVRTAAELTARWYSLLDPPEFAARSLWLTWFGADGRQLPIVIPVDGVPRVPDVLMLVNLRQLHEQVLSDQLGGRGHLALALCRPGPAVVTADDDAWLEALRELLDDGDWSLHLAADGSVVPLVQAG